MIVSSSSWSFEDEDEESATEESRRAARIVVHRKAAPGDDTAVYTDTTDADVVAWLKSEDPPLAVDERSRFMAHRRLGSQERGPDDSEKNKYIGRIFIYLR